MSGIIAAEAVYDKIEANDSETQGNNYQVTSVNIFNIAELKWIAAGSTFLRLFLLHVGSDFVYSPLLIHL